MKEYRPDKKTERALGAYASLARAVESVNTVLSRQLDSFGLTIGQFRALATIWQLGPVSHVALSEKLLCRASTVNVVVRNLKKFGLAARLGSEKDGREATVHLTPEGRRLISKVFPLHANAVRARMAALNGREQESLRSMCQKLDAGDPVKFLLELATVDVDELGE